MGMLHIVILQVLAVNILLTCRLTQGAEDVEAGPPPTTPKVLVYNCMNTTNMNFDTSMLPEGYHKLTDFTIQNCKEVDFYTSQSNKPLEWRMIHFRNINTLRLRLTQLPISIHSIEIDNLTLDEMSVTLTHFQATWKIHSLIIKNSVLKNISMDVFKNPTFHDVTFSNVIFQTMSSNALSFKFSENSSLKIEKSTFENDLPQGAIATHNVANVYVTDTTFASKLMENSANLVATGRITVANVTFAKLLEQSVKLSAPTIQIIQNSFHKIATHSIVLSGSYDLAMLNNTFQEKVKNPLSLEQHNQENLPKFVGNSFYCDSSYNGDATQWMVNIIEQFASENQTICYLLGLNSCNFCSCDTKQLFHDVRKSKNCSSEQKNTSNSNSGNFKYMGIVILVVNIIIVKIFQ